MKKVAMIVVRNSCKQLNQATITCLLLIPCIALGQKLDFTLKTDHHDHLIGEHVPIWMEVSADRMITIQWPKFSDTLTHALKILHAEDRDSSMGHDGVVHYSQKIIVSAFESGTFVIDNIAITFLAPGQSQHLTRYADPLSLTFKLPPSASDLNLRDIKKPLALPVTLREVLLFMFWIALTVVMITLLYRYIRKYRKKKKSTITVHTPLEKGLNPWEQALQHLKDLQQSDLLWVHGVKAFHIELSNILRVYIRDAHQVNAPELTTKQALQSLRHQVSISEAQHTRLTRILERADLVKFAKYTPCNEENTSIMGEAICFVTDTAPVHLQQEVIRKEETL